MSAQAGNAFLLQSGDGAGTEVFTTLGGLRNCQFTIDAQSVDVTNHGSSQWKELLTGVGIRSVKISGSGVFTNTTNEVLAQTRCMGNTVANYRITDGVTNYTGAFKITKLERAGDFQKEQTYSISLESSGAITVATAP